MVRGHRGCGHHRRNLFPLGGIHGCLAETGRCFSREGDAAFVQAYGYARIVKSCVAGILKKYEYENFGHFSVPASLAPDNRVYSRVVKSLNLSPGSFLKHPLLTTVGDTGTAAPLMLLAAALERATPGERLLLCSYGAGNSDAFLFQVIPEVERLRDKRGPLAGRGVQEAYDQL